MSVITQPNDLADLLRFEAENRYSRERLTLSAGHNLTLGTVIATPWWWSVTPSSCAMP